MNPLAHELLDTFGSLKGVLEARPEQLLQVNGIGEETATLISLVVPMLRRYELCLCEERKVILNRRDAEAFCSALLSGLRTEHFYAVCLSADNHVLGRRLIAQGSLTEVAAYPRLVAETALNYNAHSVLLCHNHPSGSCQPSGDDIRTTLRLQQLLRGLDMVLLDHIVVGGGKTYSMSQHGDFNPLAGAESLIPAAGGSVLMPGESRHK